METINIICVDDQADVLDSVVRDLRSLEPDFRIEEAGSAAECRELMNSIDADGGLVALVISDHVMPGETGVELLKSIDRDVRFDGTKKVLLTGLATHSDTILAINEAHINNYFEKPWNPNALLGCTRSLLTEYILDKGLEYQKLMPKLDAQVILERLHKA